ncbi:T9SS type A sorting domain-containing protein [Rubrivirga sp.]|uniref:T9SS type A sorting domain-containing protein n=1 Tax=Rubrivirga sp. TaxID=1885344 RepID=UPI003C7719C5
MRALLLFVAVATVASAQVDVSDANCTTNGTYQDGPPSPTEANAHIAWPADNPIWEFDVYRPTNRTTINSSGLEIRNATFRGRKVFERAGVPVLNVEYDEGGCGCFRDWQDREATTELGDGAVLATDCGTNTDGNRSGIAISAPGAVQTACEANADLPPTGAGGDVGNFVGIAIEDYGTELVLTGHARAGWYRYRMKWHFYTDGRVWPEFSFAAAEALCTETGHRHHAYWRFDFDLEGTPQNDIFEEITASSESVLEAELARVLGGVTDQTYWSVTDEETGFGYEIVPSEEDRRLMADEFSKVDALVLRYKLDEIDDGLTVNTGCAFAYEPFVDGEAILGEDTVFWYRSGALHEAGSPFECDIVGPMLRPVGMPATILPDVEDAEFEAVRPNPFDGVASTRFRVTSTQQASVELYDLTGRRVAVLFEGTATADTWQDVRIDARDLPAGTYIVRLRGETASGTTRVVLVR